MRSGIGPTNWLLERSKCCREVMVPRAGTRRPVKKLPERVRFWRDLRGKRVKNLSSPERLRRSR